MPSKSHMEKVLIQEGYERITWLGEQLWYDPLGGFSYAINVAYKRVINRQAARERRELKAKGWFYNDMWRGYFDRYGKGVYTRKQAIQLERGRAR